ncbi:hypothetical protein ACFLQX_01495 [Bacteroidota bacterium]
MHSYNKADQLLHLLSQVIAKTNRAFVPAKEDDSHTNLSFDRLSSRIVGRWINSPKGNVMLSLNLFTLDFEWLEGAFNVIQTVPSVGKSIEEIEQGIVKSLSEMGLESTGFQENLHFEIPVYSVTDKLIPSLGIDEISDWIYYRKLANEASEFALGMLNANEDIRIWPHHFDTGIYALAENKIGIGFGLTMEDSLAGEPYFYISGYPAGSKSINYDEVPELKAGQWELGEFWKGAVLPISMVDSNNEADAINTIATFIEEVVGWFGKQD